VTPVNLPSLLIANRFVDVWGTGSGPTILDETRAMAGLPTCGDEHLARCLHSQDLGAPDDAVVSKRRHFW